MFRRAVHHLKGSSRLAKRSRKGRYNMKIAVEGCCHGELDATYAEVASSGQNVDALLICGDFQAVRNYQDLQCMAVPDKYRDMRQFYQYYTGEKKAPVLTLVIGGNHEASNYMWELYHGGWLAPNIYFLGHAGCVRLGGLRVAGSSGIFKDHDFPRGHFEQLPYTGQTMRSIYHTREFCVRKLSLLSRPDIFMSHDWPQYIEQHGDVQGLLRRKSFFKSDIERGQLGSPPMMGLLRNLQPRWWFAAHLHTRFEASVAHENAPAEAETVAEAQQPQGLQNPDEITIDEDDFDAPVASSAEAASSEAAPAGAQETQASLRNDDEIALDDEEVGVAPPPAPVIPPPKAQHNNQRNGRVTRFLALDKCLPRRKFLEIIDIPPLSGNEQEGAPQLCFDREWLAITRAFQPLMAREYRQPVFPPEDEAREMVARELHWVNEHLGAGDLLVRNFQTFAPTAPGGLVPSGKARREQPPEYSNPQTEALCALLQMENKVNSSATSS
ncbi:hypothetical protein FISHEDRAFT_66180 [Fistulina hepatica ATCC 64428]|uniref:Lariat debranching enzyme C-terminal domain-containing protein n=1 Tax=Fistulina hepatica ATCC 64428 TaxID=1128425 RepID=A0A0D7A9R5_9AGAR|nr:hypothetical protein FISHEDRAFT_66180 [Fistulina hepatica ATCC 64428]